LELLRVKLMFSDDNNLLLTNLTLVATSGVSRVWQAWHMVSARLWRRLRNCWQKWKSLFTVSLTSVLRPIHS